MEIMVNNLRLVTPPHVFIETPFALSYAHSSNIEWHHILIFFSLQTLAEDKNGIFLFPTFTGSDHFGHWHLTIIEKRTMLTWDT